MTDLPSTGQGAREEPTPHPEGPCPPPWAVEHQTGLSPYGWLYIRAADGCIVASWEEPAWGRPLEMRAETRVANARFMVEAAAGADSRGRVEALAARVRQLEHAIREYAYGGEETENHALGCAEFDAYQRGPCDCGMVELLAALAAVPAPGALSAGAREGAP
jgi:hypothetical protein